MTIKKTDYKNAPSAIACQVFGVSNTTLDKWRMRGAPFVQDGRNITWDIPMLVAWKIQSEKEKVKPNIEIKKDDNFSDEELALKALRSVATNETGIAQVSAAKALLQAAEKDVKPDAVDAVIAFAEIDNIDDHINIVTSPTIQCPYCKKEIKIK